MSTTAEYCSSRQWLQLILLFIFIVQISQINAASSIEIQANINPFSAGQISTIKCEVSNAKQSPTMTWKIGDREIESSYYDTTASSIGSNRLISITNELRYPFQLSDNGKTIACTARQPDGSWVSSYTQLRVNQQSQNSPTAATIDISNSAAAINSVEIQPIVYPLIDGQISTFKCDVSYTQQSPTITWKIGDREVDPSYHDIKASSAGSNRPITVTDELRYPFQSSDNGKTISCIARMPNGAWSSSYMQLSVIKSPNAPATSGNSNSAAAINSVDINPAINPITVNAGKTSTIKCDVSYTQQSPTITWKIGDREINSSYHDTTASSAGSNRLITVTDELRYPFQSTDNGKTISCIARMPNGAWSSSYTQLRVL